MLTMAWLVNEAHIDMKLGLRLKVRNAADLRRSCFAGIHMVGKNLESLVDGEMVGSGGIRWLIVI